ncbi:MAG: pyridoxamine 5'-phosphate oxidase family protein [Eubacteriales bacterium]
MSNGFPKEAQEIMDQRFGYDTLISLATVDGSTPSVRVVNSYYESGSFYVITNSLSNKMRQIAANPAVAVCGEWFTAHGIGENLGYLLRPQNEEMAGKLRAVFAEWYGNGHVNEADPHTVLLRLRLTDGVLFSHGTRYDIDFTAKEE